MSAARDTGDRLQELESRSAFQDELFSQLNDVVARQDRELRELRRQLRELDRRLKDLGESVSAIGPGEAEETPPHY